MVHLLPSLRVPGLPWFQTQQGMSTQSEKNNQSMNHYCSNGSWIPVIFKHLEINLARKCFDLLWQQRNEIGTYCVAMRKEPHMATKELKTTAGVATESLSCKQLPLLISLLVITGLGTRNGGSGISPSSRLSDVSMIIFLEGKRGRWRSVHNHHEMKKLGWNCRRNL